MKHKKRILLTNDDGIDSESLWALKDELSKIAECEIAAPRYPATRFP